MEINDQEFEKYKRMIHKIARRFYYATRAIELNDLISQGYWVFCRCQQTFDPETKVKFSTYLYSSLNSELHRYIGNQLKHYKQRKLSDVQDLNPKSKSTQATQHFLESISRLSKESQTVIKIILDCPAEFFEQPKLVRKLKKLLSSLNWRGCRRKRIQKAIREIKTFLASY